VEVAGEREPQVLLDGRGRDPGAHEARLHADPPHPQLGQELHVQAALALTLRVRLALEGPVGADAEGPGDRTLVQAAVVAAVLPPAVEDPAQVAGLIDPERVVDACFEPAVLLAHLVAPAARGPAGA